MAKDDFRFIANYYDRLIKPKEEIVWKNIICDQQFDKLLDVGGGTGRATQYLIDCAAKLYISDISFPMLTAAKSKNLFQEICCSIEKAPFANAIFDCIVMIDAFHHLINQKEALDQVLSLLKPGGIFILEEPDIRNFRVKLIAIAEKILLMRSHFIKSETVASWINKSDFSVEIKIDGINYYLVVKKKIKSNFVNKL